MLGVASRRQAENWIEARKISVNGQVVDQLGFKVDPEVDEILINGKPVDGKLPPRVYWLLHKPNKLLTSRVGTEDHQTIYDLPVLQKLTFLVSPVGRLDFMTEGLLLMSNDGELANRLTHPKYEVPRMYQVLIKGKLTEQDERKVAKRDVMFDDGPCPKVDLKYVHGQSIGTAKGSWYFVTVYEGRNRLVRRLFETLGFEVKRLIRYGFGPLRLPDDLPPGEYKQLTAQEIDTLRKMVGL